MFRLLTLAAMTCVMWGTAANASTLTYDFNDQFLSFSNNLNSIPDNGPGGILSGSLSVDPSLTGTDFVVAYNLTSYLPNGSGGVTRSSVYDSTLSNQELRISTTGGTVLNLIARGGGEWHRLVLDFGAALFGSDPISVVASEHYYRCGQAFGHSYPKSSCTLANFGVGLGTGVLGGNGATQMLAGLEGGIIDGAVPLPAGAPLLGAALGLLALLRGRRRPTTA